MFHQLSALTRNVKGDRFVRLWAAYELDGAYLGTFTLADLQAKAQGQFFWTARVHYRAVGTCINPEALSWHPNGLTKGVTAFDFDGFCLSPVRETESDSGEIVRCAPDEAQFWSIYGFHSADHEWQIVHDAEAAEIGEALARLVDLTGHLIEYRDESRAYANIRLADLPELLSQRILDQLPEDSDPARRMDDADNHPLTELRESILAALDLRGK